jgi:ribosomal protein L20A (L18A)
MSKNTRNIKNYIITGTIIINKEKIKFSKALRSTSENEAKESVFLHYGSKHHIKRQVIKIQSVKVSEQQIEDPIGEVLSSTDNFKYIRG